MPTATTTMMTGGVGGSGSTYNSTNPYVGTNPYGNSGGGGSAGSGSYYGASSSGAASGMYATNTQLPPSSAFGIAATSSTTTSSAMLGGDNTNMYEMGGPIGGGGGSASSSIMAPPHPTASAAAVGITPHVFDPRAAAAAAKKMDTFDNNTTNNTTNYYEEDYDNEPPLLEELGVNFPHIYSKSRAVLFPFGKHAKSLESGFIENDADLAGPLAFALGLGGELLLSGKLHFGYVYGFGVSGCMAMTFLLNLLNPNGAVSMWTVISILGYALLPVNLLAGLNMILRVHKLGWIGMVLAVLTIVWCTTASARLFERGCNMREQRFLVAYPTALLYSAFVIITIF